MLHSDIAEIAAVALGGGSSDYRDDQQGALHYLMPRQQLGYGEVIKVKRFKTTKGDGSGAEGQNHGSSRIDATTNNVRVRSPQIGRRKQGNGRFSRE